MVPGGQPDGKGNMVEAAGIEPASVTGTPSASTCLAACYFTGMEARPRAAISGQSHFCFARAPGT